MIGYAFSESVSSITDVLKIEPKKSLLQITAGVDFLRKQEQSIPVKIEEFSSPVEYMVRLRRFRLEYPDKSTSGNGKGLSTRDMVSNTGMPRERIEQAVHDLSDGICVKWEIPKVYKVETKFLANATCTTCRGRGTFDKFAPKTEMVKCPECSGTGKQITGLKTNRAHPSSTRGRGVDTLSVSCPRCRGKGEVASTHTATYQVPCPDCQKAGKVGVLKTQLSLLILVPSYNQAEAGSK